MSTSFINIFFLFSKLLWMNHIHGFPIDSQLAGNQQAFTNKWAVHIQGGEIVAREVAEKNNFIFHGQLGSLKDYYHLEHRSVRRRSRRSAGGHHKLLENHQDVIWVEQQRIKKRVKRSYQGSDPLFKQQWYLKNDGE